MPLSFCKISSDLKGFYQVLYSLWPLQKLGQNPRDGLLSPEDRIGITSDALAMASSAQLKTSRVLGQLGNFEAESSYFVWKRALEALETTMQARASEDGEVLNGLYSFRKKFVQEALRRVG
ncbi:ERAP1-like C-terminal domain-containing protein [Bisporella sp. PMI_857]|nr:ERAP1-like C-terminal domain-containing protein [Bisporella sp. PMI_857]